MSVNNRFSCKLLDIWLGSHNSHKHRSGTALQKLISIGILLQILVNCGFSDGAIRSMNLQVDPPAVRRGSMATLRCLYDLEGAPLYSVKFYRGLREFFRFSPTEIPKSKIFPFPGINVDGLQSNASQVVIRNVGFGLSGNFSCEVTADAPSFSTAQAYTSMQVVELPESRPTLWTDQNRYEPGDVLRANCSSPPSRPKAELTLALNNMVMYSAETQYFPTIEGLIASRISIRLQLQSSNFGGGSLMNIGGGQLVLRCTAQIGNFYQEYAEVDLGFPQRDPMPQRVTSSDASISAPLFTRLACTFTAILIMLTYQNLR